MWGECANALSRTADARALRRSLLGGFPARPPRASARRRARGGKHVSLPRCARNACNCAVSCRPPRACASSWHAPSEAAEPADKRRPAASFVGHRDHVTVKSLPEQKVYGVHHAAVVAAAPAVNCKQ